MDAGWLPLIAVLLVIALAVKIVVLVVLARWIFGKLPAEQDYSASVVYSRAGSRSPEDGHIT